MVATRLAERSIGGGSSWRRAGQREAVVVGGGGSGARTEQSGAVRCAATGRRTHSRLDGSGAVGWTMGMDGGGGGVGESEVD
jgi:hypothetical protein